MTRAAALATLSLALTASASHGAVVAVWNFNNNQIISDLVEVSRRQLATKPTLDVSPQPESSAGTTTNADSTDGAGYDLTVKRGAASNTLTKTYNLDLTGYKNVSLSYATRRSPTGFTDQTWSYSVDGGNTFTAMETVGAISDSGFTKKTVDFSSAKSLNNTGSVLLRLTAAGATNTSGNTRFDNVVFSASANAKPVVASVAVAPAVFVSDYASGVQFSATVVVSDTDTLDALSLVTGTAPAGISNLAVTGGGTGATGGTFTVTGTADYSLNLQTVEIPFTASDGATFAAGQIALAVVPEPISATTLAAGLLLAGRRRR